jgi:carbon monoxide dehydrogenase subunit G
MPVASFHHTAIVDAPIESVWQRLQSEETWALLGPVERIWDAVHDPSGELVAYQWSAVVGPTTYRGSGRVSASDAPHRMALELDSSEVTGELTARLSSNGAGTTLDVSLDIASKGVLAGMFFPIVAAAVGNGLPEQVDGFAATFH